MKKLVYIILCLEGAVLSFNVAAAAALIPSIAGEFAATQFVVARIVWLYMLPYGLAALLYGPLVRAIDAKKIELACLLFFSLANLAAGLAVSLKVLFWARFFMGVFGASVIPLALILIARHTPSNQRGRAVGIFFSSTFVASLLGLFLSGLIPWRWIFLIPAGLGFLLWPVIYFYLPSFKEDLSGFRLSYFFAFKNKKVLYIFTYIFFISLFYHGVQQWLAVYFSRSLGFNQLIVSLLVILTSLSGIIGEAVGGWCSDSLGRRKTVDLGIILMIFSLFLLLFKLPLAILAFLMVIWGIGWTFNHAGISTMLTDLPAEFLNESASLNSSVRFISGGLGAMLAGLLMQRSFVLGFAALGFCLIGLLVFTRSLIDKN